MMMITNNELKDIVCERLRKEVIEPFLTKLYKHDQVIDIVNVPILDKVIPFLGEIVLETFDNYTSTDAEISQVLMLREVSKEVVTMLTKCTAITMMALKDGYVFDSNVIGIRPRQTISSYDEIFITTFKVIVERYLEGYVSGFLDILTNADNTKGVVFLNREKYKEPSNVDVRDIVDALYEEAKEIAISKEQEQKIKKFVEGLLGTITTN